MSWSFTIGKPAGIAVRVHVTFALLLVWAGFQAWMQSKSAMDAVMAMGWVMAIFTLVILHELGHALMARRFGCKTEDILLLPIGGVARLQRMPDKPGQELAVAVAGPAVNLVLAIALYAIAQVSNLDLTAGSAAEAEKLTFVAQLFWANVALAVFNMVPAFPMDGGRALRAFLALRYDRVKATRIAAGLGQAVAVLLGFIGLSVNPMLVLIALFVWMGAAAERGQVVLEDKLHGVTTAQAMMTHFEALQPASVISEAVEHILAGFQEDFPIVLGDRVVGLLERDAVVKALSEGASNATVIDYVREDAATIEASAPLTEAVALLGEKGQSTLPVVHRGALVGLLTAGQLGEFVMLGDALREYAAQRSQGSGRTPSGSQPEAINPSAEYRSL